MTPANLALWKATDTAPPLTAETFDRAMRGILSRPPEPILLACGSDREYEQAVKHGYNAVRVLTERDLA